MDFTPETVMRLSKRASAKVKKEALDWINVAYWDRGVQADDFDHTTGQPKLIIALRQDQKLHPPIKDQDGIADFLPFLDPIRFALSHNSQPATRGRVVVSKLVRVAVSTVPDSYGGGQHAIWVPDHPTVSAIVGEYAIVVRGASDADIRDKETGESYRMWHYWAAQEKLPAAIYTVWSRITGRT